MVATGCSLTSYPVDLCGCMASTYTKRLSGNTVYIDGGANVMA